MRRQIFISTLLLFVMLFVQVLPVQALPSPVVAYTDWAQFVADVTVPDGTVFAPGTAFTKTWRLKNIGTSTWTTSFSLVYVSGDPLGAPAAVSLPSSVAPGGTIDLSVNMTAPATNGTFKSSWALKNASGILFGIGSSANAPFWAQIVVGSGSSGIAYDFTTNASSATWSSQTATLALGGTPGDPNGFVNKVDNVQLENGSSSGQAGLYVGPNASSSGYVAGIYPNFTVQSGDRFKATISCAYNTPGCNVFFRLDYIEGGVQKTYWTFHEKYEGLYYNVSLDLTPLAGRTVKFMLDVYKGSAFSSNDRAIWVSPRIERGGGVVPPIPTIAPGTCTDRVAFIADVTVPDNTQFAPSTAFTKVWRLKNVGTCTWSTSYTVYLVSGDGMGATYPAPLPNSVAPGQTVDVSVNMVAPATDGTYRGNWALKNAAGSLFALGAHSDVPFWVQIRVGTGGIITTPIPGCTNKAGFISDVTVPDNTTFVGNTAFTKTWQLKNTGTCTWDPNYAVTFVSGDPMSASYPVKINTTVAPGQKVNVSVNMVAPAVNGIYRGNWALKSSAGQVFALGVNADVPFWVQIRVVGTGPTATPTSTLTPGTPVTPTATADLSVTITDGKTTYIPGGNSTYTIVVTNNGPNNVSRANFMLNPPPASQVSSFGLSCVPDAGAFCVASASGPGGVPFTDTMILPAFTKVIYTVTMYFPSGATGDLTPTVTAQIDMTAAATDPNLGNNTASDTNTAAPVADLVISNTDGTLTYTPGGQLTYTIVVVNNGPSDVVGAIFDNTVSSQITSWTVTCAPSGGATCTAAYALGPGETHYGDTVSIPSGANLVITVVVQINLSATGSVVNTASISPPAGTTDPIPGNNTVIDSNNP
jgi:uncharacterized repeat protein (TIGR01451 family)